MERTRARRYRWTNVGVLVVSIYVLAASVWATPELMQVGTGNGVWHPLWLRVAYVGGGLLGLFSIAAALRSRRLGRALALVAGLLLLSGFLALRQFTAVALLSLGIPGAVLFAAGFALGPMPTPEQEGKPRAGPGR